MNKFWRNNSLSIVFVILFIIALLGQIIAGYNEHNKERKEEGRSPVSLSSYLQSGHFLQATFEIWESEFLQMALFVALTISLRQKALPNQKNLKKKKKSIVNLQPSVKMYHGLFIRGSVAGPI